MTNCGNIFLTLLHKLDGELIMASMCRWDMNGSKANFETDRIIRSMKFYTANVRGQSKEFYDGIKPYQLSPIKNMFHKLKLQSSLSGLVG